VEDLIIKGKDSRINKSKEGNKMNKSKKLLYGLEGVSKERRDYIQEIIDKWIEEDLQERKERMQESGI
jgi:DNA polymerase III alpha subunit